MRPNWSALPCNWLSQADRKATTFSSRKTGWSTLSHSWMLHRAVAQSLRDCSLVICMKDTMPFLSNVRARRGTNPLHVAPPSLAAGSSSTLEKEAKRPGAVIIAAFKREIYEYRGTFPATFTLLPLAVLMSEILGSDIQTLIKAMAVTRVEIQDDTPTGRVHAVADG